VHDEIARSDLLERTSYVETALTPDALAPVPSIPLERGRHDVVHAHFGPNARRFLFAREQAGAPLVVTFHGYDYSAQPRTHGASMYQVLFEVADVVTFNCEASRRALESLGCPARKLRALRMPVAVADFPFAERHLPATGPVRILTVGRLVEKKGHEIVLRALALVHGELPDLRYDIVGDGPLATRLRSLVSDLGLDAAVRFHGACTSSCVRRLLAHAHVFVLASRVAADGDEEGTPVALMEAQASGLPVVSTCHGGIAEVVLDGRSGLLVPEGDPEALADAIHRLVADHEAWPALGAAGRAHVETTFDVGPCTEQLLGVYAVAAGVTRRIAEASSSQL
jgi:colanic acid/amylovoran biosynthesis glycosyltransferase